jgi:glycosyltransferase involved in cell wall biosynthesis
VLPISVIIITKNEEKNIEACISAAKQISCDIVVVDSGSTDATIEIALEKGARVIPVKWYTYGHSRNIGASEALYNWIITLDADERITPQLIESIKKISLNEENIIYRFKRSNFYVNRKINFGDLGFDRPYRLYNRNFTKWNMNLVHEELIKGSARIKVLNASFLHYGIRNRKAYLDKMTQYARLSAYKYLSQGRKAGIIKRYISPLFNSFKSYILQLGFLDGRKGFEIAITIAYYTWLKYYYLNRLNTIVGNNEIVKTSHKMKEALAQLPANFF